jgi:predicted ester cyclase
MAMRAFGAFPTLKLRVRRLILQPDESAATGALNDAQLRVLLDLRDATHQRHADGR